MKIQVNVKTGRKNSEIKKIDGNIFHVDLKSKPVDNKANIELIRLLSNYFNRSVVFVSGLKSKKKIIEVID
ncbi:MAG: DUF167 domain-containing protein [Nanoarchaeota archaeon]